MVVVIAAVLGAFTVVVFITSEVKRCSKRRSSGTKVVQDEVGASVDPRGAPRRGPALRGYVQFESHPQCYCATSESINAAVVFRRHRK